MKLDQKCFDRINEALGEAGYPTGIVEYAGATIVEGGPVIWFACRDRRFSPHRGQRVAFDEDFQILYTKPLVQIVSVGEKQFRIACSKGGRTVSRVN